MVNLSATLTQATNLILLLKNSNQDIRKFVVWKTENDKPVEVLKGLYIAHVSVENQKKIFEHPIETGAIIVDHEILEAKKVNIQAYISLDDSDTLTELEQLYIDGTLLIIRADNRIIENMLIASQPFEITGSVFDKTLYSISFKEAQTVTPQYVAMPKTSNKANTSRVNSGVKQAQETTKKQSWLRSLWQGGRT